MPLSEHEQRLLEQIEQALYAEDPKFARTYRSTDLRSHYRRRLVKSAVGVGLGLVTLLAGVITRLYPVGILGFLLMLVAALIGIASWQRMSGRVTPRSVAAEEGSAERQPRSRAPRGRGDRGGRGGRGGRAKAPRGPRRGLLARLEERWERRQEGRGER